VRYKRNTLSLELVDLSGCGYIHLKSHIQKAEEEDQEFEAMSKKKKAD
jgi:hypothetical protein